MVDDIIKRRKKERVLKMDTINFDFLVEVVDVNSHVRRDFGASICIVNVSQVVSLCQCHDLEVEVREGSTEVPY